MLNNGIEANGRAVWADVEAAPLVSAVITTHNREPGMVVRAVKSALNQTYPNMELIVVDDSSPSFARRAEVERSVRGLSDAILYLKHEACQGACAARNTGLSHAKGCYVGFLDDDDEWLPAKIEAQVRAFDSEDTALVYGRNIIIVDPVHREFVSGDQGASGYIFEELIKSNFIGGTSNPLIKRACIDAVGDFDIRMASCQDYDLWLRLAVKYPVRFIDAPLLRYHVHPGDRISGDAEKKISGYERLNMKYAAYIHGDSDTWYMRNRVLIPFYLAHYGRRRAAALWLSCIRKRPGRMADHLNGLAMIALGHERYTAARSRLGEIYHTLRGDQRA